MYEKFNLVFLSDIIIITLRSKVKSNRELNLKLILWLKYWKEKKQHIIPKHFVVNVEISKILIKKIWNNLFFNNVKRPTHQSHKQGSIFQAI